MTKLQPVRGTHDLLPDAHRSHRHVMDLARATANLYGYQEMATPIFEFTEVFKRTLGDVSDIVTKEMYTFVDKGGDCVSQVYLAAGSRLYLANFVENARAEPYTSSTKFSGSSIEPNCSTK